MKSTSKKASYLRPKCGLLKSPRVGVFCGGKSSERKISKLSGGAVYRALKASGFQTCFVDPAVPSAMERKIEKIDVAFLALHGHGGEDGTIQRYLEKKKVPYVGSDARGSRNAFDKLLAKRLFIRSGIPTPQYHLVKISNWRKKLKAFKAPYFVKPPREGSSIGIFQVMDFKASSEAIQEALLEYGELIVEKKIEGREFTVGVLGSKPLPPIELLPKNLFYDYHAKYTKGMTDYQVPAKISRSLWIKLQRLALKVHKILGLRDLSRIDIMVDKQGRPFVLEANSIPGFTEFSLLPKAAKVSGLSFEDLCSLLVGWAYQRRRVS
jgi:D-alanine-D-alanine ligase